MQLGTLVHYNGKAGMIINRLGRSYVVQLANSTVLASKKDLTVITASR